MMVRRLLQNSVDQHQINTDRFISAIVLISFRVSNFLSIREEQELSFVPVKKSGDSTNLVASGQPVLLRAAAILGGNGAGKTNLLLAMEYSSAMIASRGMSRHLVPLDHHRIDGPVYFRGDGNTDEHISSFEYSVVLSDSIMTCGFAFDSVEKTVNSEWLYRNNLRGEDAQLVYRRNPTAIEFGDAVKEEEKKFLTSLFNDDWSEELTIARLPLSYEPEHINYASAEKRAMPFVEEAIELERWFQDAVGYYPYGRISPEENQSHASSQSAEELSKILNQLVGCEISVGNPIAPDSLDEGEADSLRNLLQESESEGQSENTATNASQRFGYLLCGSRALYLPDLAKPSLVHEIRFRHGQAGITASFAQESLGFRQLFSFMIFTSEYTGLAETGQRPSVSAGGPVIPAGPGRLLIVDDIGDTLHPMTAEALLRLLMNVRESSCQFVFVTRKSELIDSGLFGKDELWFVNKQRGRSSVYSLADFREPLSPQLQRDYLEGRFEAVPVFNRFWRGE